MSETVQSQIYESAGNITAEVRESANGFLVSGIIMLVLGIAAVVFPFMATLAAEVLVAWLLVISGALGVVHAFRVSRWKGFTLTLLTAGLALAVGVLMLFHPFPGILTITLLMAAFFLVGGLFRIILALQLRPLDHWGWLLASGVVAILLAVLVLSQWPEAAGWFIGLMLGIDLIFGGVNAIMLSMAARRYT